MPGRPFDPLPDFIDPELATLVERAPEGDAWVHEIKLDGYCVGSRIERGKARVLTRHANDWTPRFRPNATILAELPVKVTYLDGEMAVLTAEGVSDFGVLQEALGRHGGSREISFIAFDLLYLDGRELRPLPLIEHKAILEKSLAKLPAKNPVQFSGHVTTQGPEFFALACKPRLEVIISKLVN
jgi:bifunctional non-homologous end joining protein LigD